MRCDVPGSIIEVALVDVICVRRKCYTELRGEWMPTGLHVSFTRFLDMSIHHRSEAKCASKAMPRRSWKGWQEEIREPDESSL